MAYDVPDLPYEPDALEPHIDEETMRIHHDKHHQAYVDKANAALEGSEWADKDVEEVLQNLDSLPEDKQAPVRNNAGGHANHSLFWTILGPKKGGPPSGEIGEAIRRSSNREHIQLDTCQATQIGDLRRHGVGQPGGARRGLGTAPAERRATPPHHLPDRAPRGAEHLPGAGEAGLRRRRCGRRPRRRAGGPRRPRGRRRR